MGGERPDRCRFEACGAMLQRFVLLGGGMASAQSYLLLVPGALSTGSTWWVHISDDARPVADVVDALGTGPPLPTCISVDMGIHRRYVVLLCLSFSQELCGRFAFSSSL